MNTFLLALINCILVFGLPVAIRYALRFKGDKW